MESKAGKFFLIVDDKQLWLCIFEKLVKKFFSEYELKAFSKFKLAEDFIKTDILNIAVAILDGKLDEGRFGYELASQIKEKEPSVVTVLFSADPETALPEDKKFLFNFIFNKNQYDFQEIASKIKALK